MLGSLLHLTRHYRTVLQCSSHGRSAERFCCCSERPRGLTHISNSKFPKCVDWRWRCSYETSVFSDRLCDLVVRVNGYRSRGPGSITGVTRFFRSSGSAMRSTQPREHNWGATWKKSSGSGLESREYGRTDPSRWPRGTLYPQKLALTSPTSGGCSVGIVRSWTQATELVTFPRPRSSEVNL
jgi:hypothetical protein